MNIDSVFPIVQMKIENTILENTSEESPKIKIRKEREGHSIPNSLKIFKRRRGRPQGNPTKRLSDVYSMKGTRGKWTEEENQLIRDWVSKNGPCKWRLCSEIVNGRSSSQCRERWLYALDPSITKEKFSKEDDYKMYLLYSKFGSFWEKFALDFPHKSGRKIKNRFFFILRRTNLNLKGDKSVKSSISGKKPIFEELKPLVPLCLKNIAKDLKKQKGMNDDEFQTYSKQLIKDFREKIIESAIPSF